MIRLFTVLNKINFQHVPSGMEIFNVSISQQRITGLKCPQPCKTRGHMKSHDHYCRRLIDYDKAVLDHIVEIERAKCGACGDTHAALPDVLVPYKTYSIIFILKAIKEYFHTRAATHICKKYGIAISTLYAWRDRYLAHTSLELGAIVECALLEGARRLEHASDICTTGATHDFYERFGFSLLQHTKTTVFSSA
jgi:hypothetical protein